MGNRSYRERLDPNGETKRLAEGMAALSTGPFAFFLKRLGVDPDTLEDARGMRQQFRDLISVPDRVAEHLAPLGWVAFGGAPHDEYQQAAELAESGDLEAAEELLVEAWNEPDRMRWLLKRVQSLYHGTPEQDAIGFQRWLLIEEALALHESEDDHYAGAIVLALTQIDGIVFDCTGEDAKSFFATGKKAGHLVDDETLAGHPEGVKALAQSMSRDRRTTTTDGKLIRHGIIHGRELGFGTKANSTKALVCLCAVIEKMKPLADIENARLIRQWEERHTGSHELDEFGRRLDRRGFKEAQASLESVASYQFGRFKHKGSYADSLDELDLGRRKTAAEGLVLKRSDDGTSYRAWAPTPPGIYFGIAGAEGELIAWRYQGGGPPPADLSDADAWRREDEGFHPDW